jgi:gamma-glutamylcyclotransferase (GGCT)/AIG2-like uncharacterized protein YtfP
MLSVFVYGTLKPGELNHHYCSDRILGHAPALVRGRLYALPAGYPAMTVGEGWVKGVWLTFADDQILRVLDDLEAYSPGRPESQNEYQRVWVELFNGRQDPIGYGWAYQMSAERIHQAGGRFLQSGEWPEF